jgi:hypothetical protein
MATRSDGDTGADLASVLACLGHWSTCRRPPSSCSSAGRGSHRPWNAERKGLGRAPGGRARSHAGARASPRQAAALRSVTAARGDHPGTDRGANRAGAPSVPSHAATARS